METGHQVSVPSMAPSLVSGGLSHSSYSSGIFFQGDGQRQSVGNNYLSSSFGTSSNSIPGVMHASLGSVDASDVLLNSLGNSGPSVGASSLVTDANSVLSGGPHLQRSTSINTDSYMRLPASPMSFTSNNVSVSGSSIMDGTSLGQQSSNQEPSTQQGQLTQAQQGASAATSLSAARMGQLSRIPGSFIQDPSMSSMQKKPRLEIKQEDILQQQVLQQLMQRQDSMQLHNQNPQMQAIIQQHRLRQQQQQIIQSMSPIQRVQFLQQQQQQLSLRQQLQQPGTQHISGVKRTFESGACSNRLMQYLYHQQQRPSDNSIAYWRKFVAEYYSPRAKKRWCLSQYDNVGHHSLGVFPQATMDAWQCEICGSKSGRGFEATFEVLPRLNEIKFNSGVLDELLFLDLPREVRYPNGIMMLHYEKAVQESVYEQLRVIRKGQLRVIFSPDLKILSWEFCAHRHEEFFSRKLIAPQVSQLLQVAQKCQNTINESGPDGISKQDLQANSNMVLAGGRQLARTLELQSLNDLGFSKRYVRCLQIAEVVNSMKDLMDFCREQKIGSIDGLKSYPGQSAGSGKLQMATTDAEQQLAAAQNLPLDGSSSSLNKLSINSQMMTNNNNRGVGGTTTLNVPAQVVAASAAPTNNNYQNMMLMRQNSMNHHNSNSSPQQHQQQQQETSSSSSINHHQHHHNSTSQRALQGSIGGGNFVNNQRLHAGNNNNNNNRHAQSPQDNQQQQQQQMIQQVLVGHPNNASKAGNGMGGAAAPSRSNSFRGGSGGGGGGGVSNSDSSAVTAGDNNNKHGRKSSSDLTNYLHLPDNMFQDLGNDFGENGFFGGSELNDNMGFSWKS
ncbi:probable transcriptional regulator SLK2 [Impatiens glandulifera]|uniref:probable transcriptional regulator SLK2 n=1 Tax=Impatiens glandulifera TaxID=253017 RepID=UPI001FB06127|nr:probable transcriptional regulator SLK2 [Impatiens glandulifera]